MKQKYSWPDERRDDERRASFQRRGRRNPSWSPGRADNPPAQREENTNNNPTGLRYYIPSLGPMIPDLEYAFLNHTAEGFLNLLECCYYKMEGLDSYISRTLPMSVFVHNMVQLYHVQMFRIAEHTCQQSYWPEQIRSREMLSMLNADYLLIPVEVYDWLKGIGEFTDKTGYRKVANVPQAVVPNRRRKFENRMMEGGDFGRPTAANHNAYEICIAPCVTRRLVEAQMANKPVKGRIMYTPLNDTLSPRGLVPTENLLGYVPDARPWHPEAIAAYASAARMWATTDSGSRIGYNGFLWCKQDVVLNRLGKKMTMMKGLPPIDKGSLALYGVIVEGEGDCKTILRRADGRIESFTQLDATTLAGVAIKTYRRRRVEAVPGTCYLHVNADEEHEVPPGWLATVNASYNMADPFGPYYGQPDLTLNGACFSSYLTSGGRHSLIINELLRLTVKAQ